MRARCDGRGKKQVFAISCWFVLGFDDQRGMGNGIHGSELLE